MLKALFRRIHQAEDAVLVIALITLLGMALLQIFLRNFFDAGIFWAESFLKILVLWVAMLGAMVATREAHHINIDTISRFLPHSALYALGFLTNGFSAVICLLVAWYAVEFVQFEYEDQTVAFGVVPTWLAQSIIPFGFGIMGCRFSFQAVRGVRQSLPLPVGDQPSEAQTSEDQTSEDQR